MFKQKSDPAAANPKLEPADAVRLARTKARQRLIGAVILLGIGILGFPLVFETQPRPIPVDIPIEIPRRESLPPLAMPPARSASVTASPRASIDAPSPAATSTPLRVAPRASEAVITESSADAGREIAVAKPPASSPRPAAPRPASSAATVASVTPTPTPSMPTSADGERARALLEGRTPAAAAEQRFVVQVGAFADAAAAREARKHAEKLGLKTYTQVAETSSGSRIRVRVGPFGSRGEAEAALAKAKAAGLAAVLLTL